MSDFLDDWADEWEVIDDVIDDHKYILGLDPGGTTGVAMIRYTDDELPELIYLHQITAGMPGYFSWFTGTRVGWGTNVTAVSEQWVEHDKKGVDRTPIHIEGVQYAQWGDDMVYQTPDTKQLIPDSFLKEQNLWTPNRRHQMDALIHALAYLRNLGHKPLIEALTNRTEQTIAQPGEVEAKELGEFEARPGSLQAAIDAFEQQEAEEAEAGEDGEDGSGDEGDDAEGQEGAGDGQPGDGEGQGSQTIIVQVQSRDYGDGKPSGPGGGNEEHPEEVPQGISVPDVSKPKAKRTLNGVFIGFLDDDE